MTAEIVTKTILKDKIIAIVRGIPSHHILPTVRALLAGGVRLIEITLNQKSRETVQQSCDMIRLVKKEIGEAVFLGAGTVATPEQAEEAIRAGAEYLISPNVNKEVIRIAKEQGKISIPGALTPTEAVFAHEQGADFVKLFPGGLLGTGYLKAICAPLNNIPFLVVGNVSMENMVSFLLAGAVGVGVGGELVDKKQIEAGEFDKITETAKAYISRIQGG